MTIQHAGQRENVRLYERGIEEKIFMTQGQAQVLTHDVQSTSCKEKKKIDKMDFTTFKAFDLEKKNNNNKRIRQIKGQQKKFAALICRKDLYPDIQRTLKICSKKKTK